MMLQVVPSPQYFVLISGWNQRRIVASRRRQQVTGWGHQPVTRRILRRWRDAQLVNHGCACRVLRGDDRERDRRDDKADREDPCYLAHRRSGCSPCHGAATAATHAQTTPFGALHQHYGHKAEREDQMDDENDVFHEAV